MKASATRFRSSSAAPFAPAPMLSRPSRSVQMRATSARRHFALGCHLCRSCQTGKCNWGIATQRPDLVKRLNPDIGYKRLVNLVTAWEHEIKEMMGGMGINSIEALRGNRLMLRGVGLNGKRASDSRHQARGRISRKGSVTMKRVYVDAKMVPRLPSLRILLRLCKLRKIQHDQGVEGQNHSPPHPD